MDLIYYILIVIINITFSYLIYINGKQFYDDNNKYNFRIFDIGHKYLPNLSNIKRINYSLFILNLLIPLLCGFDVMMEFESYFLLIFIIRIFINSVTILPKNKKCEDNPTIMNIIDNCYEKNFVSSLSTIILLSLILYEKKIITNINLLITINILYSILILCLRTHYTKDLLLTFFITYFIYVNKIH